MNPGGPRSFVLVTASWGRRTAFPVSRSDFVNVTPDINIVSFHGLFSSFPP